MSQWSTRIVWALGGAAAAVVIMHFSGSRDAEPAAGEGDGGEAVEVARAVVEGDDGPGPLARGDGSGAIASAVPDAGVVVAGVSRDGELSAPREQQARDGGGEAIVDGGATERVSDDVTPAANDSGVIEEASGDATPATADHSDLDGLPEVPLPKMPGTRFMRRFREPNSEGPGWEIQLGLSVPAPGKQVAAFYRAALRDAGIKLSSNRGVGGERMSDGYSGTLRGAGRGQWAQVNITQRPNRVRTVVRVVWRTGE